MSGRADFWSGLFWLAIALFVTWQGFDLGLGRVSDPGSGFAVFWIGVLLVCFSLAVIFSSFQKGGSNIGRLWDGTHWGRVLSVVGLLIVYGAVFETAGFLLSTIVLLLVLMLFVDHVEPKLAVAIAVCAPLFIWFAMTRWLKIQLPGGFLSAVLG